VGIDTSTWGAPCSIIKRVTVLSQQETVLIRHLYPTVVNDVEFSLPNNYDDFSSLGRHSLSQHELGMIQNYFFTQAILDTVTVLNDFDHINSRVKFIATSLYQVCAIRAPDTKYLNLIGILQTLVLAGLILGKSHFPNGVSPQHPAVVSAIINSTRKF